MFGLLHAAKVIAFNPLSGTKEVAVGISFARLRRDSLYVVAAVAVLFACYGTNAFAAPAAQATATSVTRVPPTPAEIWELIEWCRKHCWSPWNRSRWPLRPTQHTVAGSGA